MTQGKRKRRKRSKRVNFDVLEQIQPNAAGIDIGSEELYVCIPPGRDRERIRVFPTFTSDLHQLAKWLKNNQIDTVAMESTGVYWIPVFDILETHGLEVCLVNARHLKNVAGRKTDVSDCEWLYQLHTYGLLRDSFHPPDDIRALRSLVRHRDMLIQHRSSHIQHMQKALDLMNLKLNKVLSDITGLTGMQIIRAIIDGEHDPYVLAAFRDAKCKHSEEEIAKALTGNYRREHLFELKQAVQLYDIYGYQIEELDAELEAMYTEIEPSDDDPKSNTTPPKPHRRKRRKNQAHFDLASSLYQLAGVDLTQIDGIDALTAQTLLTEIGTDMSKWRTEKHFASWLGLCPNNQVTGGKVKRRKTRKTDNRAANALRVSAQSLARSQSALGAFYRRIKRRSGAPKANVATAHKLAKTVYFMLKYREDYRDLGADYYDKQQKEQTIRWLKKKAASLDFRLEPFTVAPI